MPVHMLFVLTSGDRHEVKAPTVGDAYVQVNELRPFGVGVAYTIDRTPQVALAFG